MKEIEKRQKQIIIVVLCLIALASVSFAHGETSEIEEVVVDTFDFNGQECVSTSTVYFNGTTTVHNICEWASLSVTENDATEEVVDEVVDGGEVGVECDESNVCETSVNPELEAEIESLLSRFRADLERFKVNEPVGPADHDYYERLKHLATCQRGTGAATGVQQADRFAVSTTWINDGEAWLKSYDLVNNHSILAKAIEECIYQRGILEPVLFGPEYLNRVIAEAVFPSMYHADVAADMRIWSQESAGRVLNDEKSLTVEDAQNTLCNHSLYGRDTKMSYEFCDQPEVVDVGGVVSYHSYALHKAQMYDEIEWEVNSSIGYEKRSKSNTISSLIETEGGYDEARKAIDWLEHYNELLKHQHD